MRGGCHTEWVETQNIVSTSVLTAFSLCMFAVFAETWGRCCDAIFICLCNRRLLRYRDQDDWFIHYRNANVSNNTDLVFFFLCYGALLVSPDLSSVPSVFSCVAGLFSDTRTLHTTATRQWS
jgi:hypothetical protein